MLKGYSLVGEGARRVFFLKKPPQHIIFSFHMIGATWGVIFSHKCAPPPPPPPAPAAALD